jgi:hypothetical protein
MDRRDLGADTHSPQKVPMSSSDLRLTGFAWPILHAVRWLVGDGERYRALQREGDRIDRKKSKARV